MIDVSTIRPAGPRGFQPIDPPAAKPAAVYLPGDARRYARAVNSDERGFIRAKLARLIALEEGTSYAVGLRKADGALKRLGRDERGSSHRYAQGHPDATIIDVYDDDPSYNPFA